MPFLKLDLYVANSIQLLAYTLILTRREKDKGEDLSEKAHLTLIGEIADSPENLNLENSIFRALDIDWKKDSLGVFEKAVYNNINGHPVEKTLYSSYGVPGKTDRLLIRLASSLFSKDAVSAKKILRNYVVILRENEILKNERRTLFSEARFRARIMLFVSASLMGFLSAANPILNVSFVLSPNLSMQQGPSQLISLLLYLVSVSILVHYSLAYRRMFKTLLYSMVSFVASFLVFNSIITTLIPHF
jgi:hypothetical protein